ncbi:MAG: amidohydrolase family protein [Gammaproteobacteria bacterium]|nr:amidohydrolase family protein [Gammaproteobacteria bacterium]
MTSCSDSFESGPMKEHPFIQHIRYASLASKVFHCILTLLAIPELLAQPTATPNGIADNRVGAYAFTDASLYQTDGSYQSGTLLIRQGRIVATSSNNDVPEGYFEIDLAGSYLYPGLVDIYTNIGLPELEAVDDNGAAENLFPTNQALNVNDAIRANFRASTAYTPDLDAISELRKLGFSAAVTHRADGIARGTSALINLGDQNASEAIVVPDVAAHYSLDKGSSTQSMPASLMGAFALIRQTALDAQWFTRQDPRPFTDSTLEAWQATQTLPQIIEVGNWQQSLTADKIGDEFNTQYILKTAGDSYRRADLIAATEAELIVPLALPLPPKVSDPIAAEDVSLETLMHWAMAPYNAKILAESDITFALTSGSDTEFWTQLRKAVDRGLPESVAINSLSSIPASMLGLADTIGSLAPGSLANFLITSGPLLDEQTVLLENWIAGERYLLNEDLDDRSGPYLLSVADQQYDLLLDFAKVTPKAKLLLEDAQSRTVALELNADTITLSIPVDDDGNQLRLSGWSADDGWQGNGFNPDGRQVSWQLSSLQTTGESPRDEVAKEIDELPIKLRYPFAAYGRTTLPEQEDFLVRGATVWTNEAAGNLVTDVLVRDGRIAGVGNDLVAGSVRIIDGTGKHLTPGIIDEHSHIALFNINETQTNSAMVRMKDVVDAENINIYRNLAGGVVAAQLLHGSANPIGGQSAIVKMRWGKPAEGLLIEGAAEFIKFALGENVKRSRNPFSFRYPQTRMGVEQVFANAFSQALEYEKNWSNYNALSRTRQNRMSAPRRDLINEAMLEVLKGERLVTAHSYVQSEINMLMKVAESFDFNINTFTHILEGYKVADKMAAHGAGGSTFADWWGYKWEVRYAIPYNAALMAEAGVVVAINSDDAEMSRRLNQEAAKAVKYGNISEIDAFKMVTLNPAILLHLDDRMGSVREGKDADLVLWSDHPLSIYAAPETTWIEGVPYYDRAEDVRLREQIASERARLIAAISREEAES